MEKTAKHEDCFVSVSESSFSGSFDEILKQLKLLERWVQILMVQRPLSISKIYAVSVNKLDTSKKRN